MTAKRAPAPRRVRIKDVAKSARVSVGTVSHLLSGSANVSAPLEQRVQKAIEALGYVPNFHAQRLRHALSRVLGICLQHTSTSYLNALSGTFEEVAASATSTSSSCAARAAELRVACPGGAVRGRLRRSRVGDPRASHALGRAPAGVR